MNKVSYDKLLEVLEYSPETGKFTWLISRGSVKPGRTAGTVHWDGYVYILIDKKQYRSTRLAFFYMTKQWPKYHMDHINRNTSDDRWCNLREATRSQNLGNRGLNKNNALGFKGVHKHGNHYRANINHMGMRYYLGSFRTVEEAHSAYVKKSKELFGKFARAA